MTENNLYSDLYIKNVSIMLGTACDFHCRHCMQHDVTSCIRKEISPDVIKYIQHLADLHPEDENDHGVIKVNFWGGEPLLYFKEIRKIVERIDRRNVEYGLVTNGQNLTNEIVDFFNSLSYGAIWLSNDGPLTNKVRDVNLLDNDDFLHLYNQLNHRGIDSVIHAYNQDYYALWEYIDNKCGKIPIAHEFLSVNWNMPSDLYQMDLSKYQLSCRTAANNLIKNILDGDLDSREYFLFEKEIKRMSLICLGKSEVQIYPNCKPYRKSANIDLQGNMWFCHNGFAKLGSVNLGYEKIYENCQDVLKQCQKKNQKGCNSCFAQQLCNEGCPFAFGDIPGQRNMCNSRRVFYQTVLELVSSFNGLMTEVDL